MHILFFAMAMCVRITIQKALEKLANNHNSNYLWVF